MTYVTGSTCVDVMDKSCVQECLADCSYEGARSLYINPDDCVNPDECVVCGAAFFNERLSGRAGPLGIPGGASALGWVGVDTPLVAAMPRGVGHD